MIQELKNYTRDRRLRLKPALIQHTDYMVEKTYYIVGVRRQQQHRAAEALNDESHEITNDVEIITNLSKEVNAKTNSTEKNKCDEYNYLVSTFKCVLCDNAH